MHLPILILQQSGRKRKGGYINMKKLAAAALTLTMAFSMSTPAYAAGNIAVDQASADIKASYQEGNTLTENVYSVDVNWGSLEYTYHPSKTKTWNTETLKYDTKGNPYWECDNDQNKITVTNHSNKAISANFEYEQVNESVDGTFNQTKINLKSAVGTDVDGAPTGTATLSLSGSMAEDDNKVLGNVKVTIGAFEGEPVNNSSIIGANMLKFYTTADDNVVMATGTFSFKNWLDLVGLTIDGTSYRLVTGINTQSIEENETIKTTLVEGSSHCGYAPKDRSVEYKYVLTINLKTKELTITATANS